MSYSEGLSPFSVRDAFLASLRGRVPLGLSLLSRYGADGAGALKTSEWMDSSTASVRPHNRRYGPSVFSSAFRAKQAAKLAGKLRQKYPRPRSPLHLNVHPDAYLHLYLYLYLDLSPSLYRELFAKSYRPLFRQSFAPSFGSWFEGSSFGFCLLPFDFFYEPLPPPRQ